MGETEYSEALKLGKKEYRARIAKGQFPYLPVLDEILSEADIQTEQNMGLVQVPLDFVVGTSTMGRTYSFAANFMPILDWETEFAVKWSNLSDAQMNEGIRDPIKAFEHMNEKLRKEDTIVLIGRSSSVRSSKPGRERDR
jgi:hypothetical protein